MKYRTLTPAMKRKGQRSTIFRSRTFIKVKITQWLILSQGHISRSVATSKKYKITSLSVLRYFFLESLYCFFVLNNKLYTYQTPSAILQGGAL